MTRVSALDFLDLVRWIDGRPLLDHVERYRRCIFADFFDARGADGRPRYNLGLFGRAKKNEDLILLAAERAAVHHDIET